MPLIRYFNEQLPPEGILVNIEQDFTMDELREKAFKIHGAREKITGYIKDQGYTYTLSEIVSNYENYYLKDFYISVTTRDVITHCLEEFKILCGR